MTGHRIAVVTTEVIAPKMAGPAIRAWHMARVLAGSGHDVELLTTERCDRRSESFRCAHVSVAELDALGSRVDVAVVQGDVLRRSPKLRDSSCVLVVDLYDPFHLEALEFTRASAPDQRRAAIGASLDVMNEQLRRGDFFLCASVRQRDFWLGQLAAVGRVNEITYESDPSMEHLLAVVPFGITEEPPRHTAPALRGVVPGIDASDRVIFWGGGIYNWFDPLTLIGAVDRLRQRDARVKLVFGGVSHPNPTVANTLMSDRARHLAHERGLVGAHVFFEQWIDYDERGSYLLEADVGVSAHAGHVETAYSFRTRILDYLWAGLPTVATEGDVLADLLVGAGAGVAVPPEDEAALEEALYGVLFDDQRRAEMAAAARQLGHGYQWPLVLRPLVGFCADPVRSPDLLASSTRNAIGRGADLMPSVTRARLDRVVDLARRGAWQDLARLAAQMARRRRNRTPEVG